MAVNLRKRVDAKQEVQEKLVKGFVAVMSFDLIEINAPSIGKNVVEDLSTSLINNDFNLVERGQLDKALKELKIQDSALIDQTTALKLGEITGCNYIIVGSVSDRGQFIVINARLLETATGKSVAAERVECRKIEIKK
jgi:TolB-like protein